MTSYLPIFRGGSRFAWGCGWFWVVVLVLVSLEGASVDAQNRRSKRTEPIPDYALRTLLRSRGVRAIDSAPAPSAYLVVLGQALYFDPILSGNRDTSCATCHHPLLGTTDGLALPVGTGTASPGLIGAFRIRGEERNFIPRNAPEVFNRGARGWVTQFWDNRILQTVDGVLVTPAGDQLPEGLESVLGAQAMFPVTSRDEMRGSLEDAADPARQNELALFNDGDFRGIWAALMERLLAIEEYRSLFREAYGVDENRLGELGFQHAAIAIAAFEEVAFDFVDSPFDRYLAGDNGAMTETQKRGAALFYGKADCYQCHAGTLLTDQIPHNIGVPQLGPGKDPIAGLDPGAALITNDSRDAYRFRTPPLRNVAVTGPYMHNGAFKSLEDVVRHHMSPASSLRSYKPAKQLEQVDLRGTVVRSSVVQREIIKGLDLKRIKLSKQEIGELLAFLESLTAPDVLERLQVTIPDRVPSGLPVDHFPE